MHNAAPRIIETVVDRAQQVVGALALTAAVMGSVASVAAAKAPVKPKVLFGERLVQPGNLPGRRIGVTSRMASLLADASVKVYETPTYQEDGYPAPTTAWCSGVKVGVGEQTYISMAAHCFSDETLVDDGVLDPLDFPANDGALDFSNRSFFTYTIEDPAVPPADRQTLATADGITISTDATDAALLKVTPNATTTGKTGQTAPSYQSIATLPYLRQANLTPGQKVAMYGTPESTDNEPVKATGTYIGVVHQPTGFTGFGVPATRPMDVVLIHPKQPYDDACFYGASGSSFAAEETRHSNTAGHGKEIASSEARSNNTAGLSGKIAISGPLSGRVNSIYDPYLDPIGYNPNPETRLKQSLADESRWRTQVEFELGVAINPKDTICEYSVVGDNTKNALVNAFGTYAPPLPVKGGGGDVGDK